MALPSFSVVMNFSAGTRLKKNLRPGFCDPSQILRRQVGVATVMD
jgi:hypothetical protein